MMRKGNMWKKIVSGVLAAVSILCTCNIEVKAEQYWAEGPEIGSPSAIVIEVNTGTVLYEKNSDEVNYPASITKIMTTMLALEYCELDEVVVFSKDAVFKNEGDTSHIARDVNEEMTMEECLYAVMLESANECAYAVAEHVGAKLGGDYQTFIDLMNEKAKEIGCTNTQFTNANGLPDENHWTSARDMALISAEAYKNEIFQIITGSRRYVIPPTNKHSENTYLNNHHRMIHNFITSKYLYEYCTGGKTGYTQAAGCTLVSYAEKDGLTLVCVIMRSTVDAYYGDTENLFEYCFQNFVNLNISENESKITQNVKNRGFMNNYGSFITLDKRDAITLPVTAGFEDAKCSFVEEKQENGIVGHLIYTYGDREVGSTDIVPAKVSVGENYVSLNSGQAESEKNIVKIKPVYIVLVILGCIVLILFIYLIKKLYDDFYIILHDIETWKNRRARFRPIEKKRRKRKKRDRMFR